MVTTKHEPFQGLDTAYRGNVGVSSWSLCVGAGISLGLVPAWNDLTRRVLSAAFGIPFDDAAFELIIKQTKWSLDTSLQGASNFLSAKGKPDTEYERILEEALYEDLLVVAKSEGLDEALRKALNNPRWLNKSDLQKLSQFFETRYVNSTAVQLARTVVRANESDRGPRSIINFNADTLLYALLDIFLINEFRRKTGSTEHPQASFAKSLRGMQPPRRDAIPIFHCHGAVSPVSKRRRRDSRDHLVFREQEYLDVAGSAFAWAQSPFLFHAQNSRMVIIGHSLADPNIRKWLAWSHSSWMEEFPAVSGATAVYPRHIWITKIPSDKLIQEIQPVSLAHLGVRVCWINDWQDVSAVLENLLAL